MIPRSQLDARIREAIDHYGGQKKLAEAVGVSQECICGVYNGYRNPGEKLLAFLGYRKVIGYERTREQDPRMEKHADPHGRNTRGATE